MRQSYQALIATMLFLSGPVTAAAEPTAPLTTATQGWSTYKNSKYGFRLSYPGGLFIKSETPNAASGAIWAAADGNASLLATATENDTSETIDSYRSFVMAETYAGARFDYTPVRDNWFVLSGEKDGRMFYERITFVCDGRYIYGWQINYPADQRRRFDAIVEAIHRSYKPGRGAEGAC